MTDLKQIYSKEVFPTEPTHLEFKLNSYIHAIKEILK